MTDYGYMRINELMTADYKRKTAEHGELFRKHGHGGSMYCECELARSIREDEARWCGRVAAERARQRGDAPATTGGEC